MVKKQAGNFVIFINFYSLRTGSNRENSNGMTQEGRPPMSTARKILLLLSILNCLAFTVIFLWILPCDYDTCQSPLYTVEDAEWDLHLDLKGQF
jgi:hypothetical protein